MNPARPARHGGVEIALVGAGPSAILDLLAEALEEDGWATVRMEGLEGLPGRLSCQRKAVVVIRAHEAELAMEALKTLDAKRHMALAIVLVDRSDPGEYFCLMQAGAVQYFEACEDPLRILQGVEWAARVLAP